MAQLNTSIDAAPRTTIAIRIGWTILITATLYVCYFSHLGAIGFVGPDEPRYAWIARDMAESGDWVTPRLYGKPWFEKPVLYYWGAAFFFKLSGVQLTPSPTPTRISANPTQRFSAETAARLPSAITALLATLALAWLALRVYGPETVRWLLLLLPTTVGMIGFSHAAATDMPFSAMLTIAMVFAAFLLRIVPAVGISVHSPGSSFGADNRILSFFFAALFGFFLGLAVLAKGPAAIILSGGAVFFWALFTRRWRDAFRLLHPVAIASFCLTALPWYILCSRRNPDFFRVFIIEHNFKRYLTPEFQHIQPFWYYVPVLLLAFFPWLALLLWSLFVASHHILQKKSLGPATLFLLTWSTFFILFFSTSHSKLPGYILPAIPAVGLLLCHSALTLGPAYRKSLAAFVCTFGGAALIALLFLSGMHIQAMANFALGKSIGVSILTLVVLTNGILGWVFLRGDWAQHRHQISALSGLPVVLLLFVSGNALRAVNSAQFTAKNVASQVQAYGIPPEKLFLLHSEHRGWQFALNFYLHRQIEIWDHSSTAEAYVLSDGPGGCRSINSQALNCSEIILDTSGGRWWVLRVLPKTSTARPAQ